MKNKNITDSTQEQAIASWIGYLNHLHFLDLVEKLTKQDYNFETAIAELQKLREFISHPEHILGSAFTKHGEIAEHVQVRFMNAEQLVRGEAAEYTFDGVARTAAEDYLRNGKMVQSKFYFGIGGTLTAIENHLDTYPWFLDNGGTYDIPKSQFEELMGIYRKGHDGIELSSSDTKLYNAIKEWEIAHNVQFDKVVRPSVVDYDDVQLDSIHRTINKEEHKLTDTDQEIRDNARNATKPTLHEGAKVTLISAGIEGGIAFVTGVYRKRKEGKKLADYTVDDWKELGVDTGTATVKGAIRGSSIYILTNFTATPAPVASAMITATIGMVSQAYKMEKGEISGTEFVETSEALCLDVTVSALSSILGEILIPVPILGAVIGNATGMFMKNIAAAYLSAEEQTLIGNYQNEMEELEDRLGDKYKAVVEKMEKELREYNGIVALAFSPDVNIRLETSIETAQYFGVPEDHILTAETGEAFFLNA